MLEEEGMDNVFARHAAHAAATRSAVRAWGLEILCANPAEYSNSLTAVVMPAAMMPMNFARSSLIALTCRSAQASAN